MTETFNTDLSQQLITLPNNNLIVPIEIKPDQNPVNCYLARLARKSRVAIISTLGVIAKIASNGQHDLHSFPWISLHYQHVSALRSRLSEIYSPARANTCLAAIRGVMKEAWMLGLILAEDYQKIRSVPAIKGERLPKGRALAGGEIKALFNNSTSNDNILSKRDTAILAVLYGCGLRRSEIVALNVEDYDPIHQSIHVKAGKGNKDRLVYTGSGVQVAIGRWLKVRANSSDAMFTRILKGDHLTNQRLSDQAVKLILHRHAQSSGVATCSPHDMRRTFISDLLDNGVDINTVSKLAGHSNITTTARYDKRGEVAKKKAVDLLHIPIK